DGRDGLASDIVYAIGEGVDGSLWFGTTQGITRYRPNKIRPRVRIISVETDQQYTPQGLPPLTTGTRITIKYSAIDFKTVPTKRQYQVKMDKWEEGNTQYSKPMKEESFDWIPKEPGRYTFSVRAIDRDLNYSLPVSMTLTVVLPWYLNGRIMFPSGGALLALLFVAYWFGMRLQTQRAIAQQFNPYIAGRVVGEDLFYGRSDLITDIERTLANNCFLLYGERRIGKTSLQHQLRERLSSADDPTYRFIPAYIDLQGVTEDDFFRTIATGIVDAVGVKHASPLPSLRLTDDDLADRRYTYRDLNRDLRTIIDHLKENETKTIKLVLLMDEVDTLNTYSLRTNLNLRGLFMGPLKENLVLVMSGLFLKMDWSAEGGGSPPFNFLSREIEIQPLDEENARKLISEPVKGFYIYEPKAIDLILEYSELRPFTIQGFCLRAVNRVLADGRTKITVSDIEGIKDSVLAEVQSIRGERAGTSLPSSLNEALALLHEEKSRVEELEAENKRLHEAAA
ncbi:ATP-binding protein, partial [Candidatus Poribacteria bacterium]|nr:ATP-binding protein [Candidatus Poribacteria bacterium]